MAVVKKTKHKVTKTRSKPTASDNGRVLFLPEKPNAPSSSMYDYTWMVFGAKGVGKTSLAAKFPNVLVIMLEQRRFNLPIMQIPQRGEPDLDFDDLLQVIKLIRKATPAKRPRTIVIDTIDRAYMLAKEYVAGGTDDLQYGQWDEVDNHLRKIHTTLTELGICVVYLSHSKVRNETVETLSGDAEYALTQPTCSPRCFKLMKELVDFAIYYGYNGTQRVLSVRGHQSLWSACAQQERFRDVSTGEPIMELAAGTSPDEAFLALKEGFHNKREGVPLPTPDDEEDGDEEVEDEDNDKESTSSIVRKFKKKGETKTKKK